MEIRIKEVSSSSELNSFIKFEFSHYAGDPNWVPPMIHDEKLRLSSKNPMLPHGELKLILAYNKNTIVGRAAVLINASENKAQGVAQARFGHIEFINNIEVSKALFKYIEDWTKAREMTQLLGPMHLASFEKAGLMYEGYEQLGTISTIYNKSYYPKHLDSLGFKYHIELEELEIAIPTTLSSNPAFFSDLGLQILPVIKKKGLRRLLTQAFILLKTSLAENGFVPLTVAEVSVYKKRIENYIHHDLVKFIGDSTGQLIAFGVATPSFAKAHQKANGKLLPFGQFQLAKAMKKNSQATLQLITLLPEWKEKGLEAAILNEILVSLHKNGFKKLGTSPERPNGFFAQLLSPYAPTLIKKRRTYLKELFQLT